MNDIQMKSRIKLLQTLHEIMMNMNDEDCYFTWILAVPDEPSENDFAWIASNDDEFNYVLDLFERLFHQFRVEE